LATKLIQRTTRTLNLTEAGQVYYQNAIKVVDSFETLNHSIHTSDQTLTGTLRIALPLSFGLTHLAPVLSEFAKLHPQLTLKLDFSDREIDLIEEGVDLAFRIGELKEAAIQARKIVPIRFVVCASEDYIKQAGLPKTPEALKHHKFLCYSPDQNQDWQFVDKKGVKHSVALDSKLLANNGDFLMQMAIAGHGVALLPTFIVWQAIAAKQLVPILADYQLLELNAYVIYPQTRFLSQKSRVFIDFLVAHFGQKAHWDAELAELQTIVGGA
jgi:DNA-binding transcriptional LysR family regulator